MLRKDRDENAASQVALGLAGLEVDEVLGDGSAEPLMRHGEWT